MKRDNKKTGYRGEELASEFLENKGYLIIERNFRTRFGEIDIVCLDGEKLVFVEVKTKIGHDFGEPEDMVSKSKLAQVQRMGEVFVEMNKLSFASDSKQNRHCESRTRAEAIPATLDIDQCAEIASVRNTETRNDGMDSGSVPGMTSWKGGCRVDVVGIVLFANGEVETIRHHEAVY